jgi:hypothetical protein
MTDRNVWHVITYSLKATENNVTYEGWKVKKEGAEKAAKRFPVPKYQKSDAKDYAEKLAKRNEPSQIKIHKTPIKGQNGNLLHPISGEKTYKNDPVESEG